MTRSDLIAALGSRFLSLTEADAATSVRLILDTLSSSLAAGDRVEIRGFGSFALNYRKARIARNPKSGAKVEVPGKYVPHFKAGKEMRERVDNLQAQKIRRTA